MTIKLAKLNSNLIIICAILAFLGSVSISAQTTSPIDAKTQKVKNEISKIGQWSDITIIDTDSKEFYGLVLEIKAESVVINEVDQKVKVEIKYDRIKKVRKGYGEKRDWQGRRIPTRKNLIGLAIAAAVAIVIPVAIVAASKE